MAAISSEIAACLSQVGDKIVDKSAAEVSLAKLADFAKEGAAAAPFLVKGLPALLTSTAHKEKKIAAAACGAVEAVIANLNQYAVCLVAPSLIGSLGNKKKPEEKICALRMLAKLSVAYPQETSWCLVDAL